MLADTPVRSGYLEALAGWSARLGPFGEVDAGYRLTPSAALYGFGRVDSGGPIVGLGYRYEWGE